MQKKIGIFWLREDFRVKKNHALSSLTKKYENVMALYIYDISKFKHQSAQRWWVSRSIEDFRKTLNDLNINLQIVKVKDLKSFFDNLTKKNNFAIYWNRVYEPIILILMII